METPSQINREVAFLDQMIQEQPDLEEEQAKHEEQIALSLDKLLKNLETSDDFEERLEILEIKLAIKQTEQQLIYLVPKYDHDCHSYSTLLKYIPLINSENFEVGFCYIVESALHQKEPLGTLEMNQQLYSQV